jgi:hypothetical protein
MFTASLPGNRIPTALYHIENTVTLLMLPVFVFTKLLPGNVLIKSVTVRMKFTSDVDLFAVGGQCFSELSISFVIMGMVPIRS